MNIKDYLKIMIIHEDNDHLKVMFNMYYLSVMIIKCHSHYDKFSWSSSRWRIFLWHRHLHLSFPLSKPQFQLAYIPLWGYLILEHIMISWHSRVNWRCENWGWISQRSPMRSSTDTHNIRVLLVRQLNYVHHPPSVAISNTIFIKAQSCA